MIHLSRFLSGEQLSHFIARSTGALSADLMDGYEFSQLYARPSFNQPRHFDQCRECHLKDLDGLSGLVRGAKVDIDYLHAS